MFRSDRLSLPNLSRNYKLFWNSEQLFVCVLERVNWRLKGF